MNTLPPASVPSTAASSQALAGSSGAVSSNPSDSGSANAASSETSNSGNFHQVLHQQLAQSNGSSSDAKASAAQTAVQPGGGASAKSAKASHSATAQSASPPNAGPSGDLLALQTAAIGAAAAQASQPADSGAASDLAPSAAAVSARAGDPSLANQLGQAALSANPENIGDSDADLASSAGATGKQAAASDDGSDSAVPGSTWAMMAGSNAQHTLSSMGGNGASDGADLSDHSGGTGAGQSFPAGSAYLMTQRSASNSEQGLFSDPSDKAHITSDIPTVGSGDATLAAAQASTTQVPAAAQNPAGSTVASASVPYQMGSDAWRADVSSHVLYFSQQDISSAQLHLNPAHLSPLNISISVDNNQTSIAFNAAHEATRQAMQDSLPQLREMFNAHGIALGQTTVGDSSAGSAQQQNQNKPQSGSGNTSLASKALESSSSAVNGNLGVRIRSLQIVDTFA